MLYHGESVRAAFSGSATIKKVGRLNFTYLFICKVICYYYCHNKKQIIEPNIIDKEYLIISSHSNLSNL